MKRRTKEATGAWPNMRDDTLKQIAGELARARKKYPDKIRLSTMRHFAEMVEITLVENKASTVKGHGLAISVYANAAALAAMAIRIMEEGAIGFPYAGNRADAPKFELTGE